MKKGLACRECGGPPVRRIWRWDGEFALCEPHFAAYARRHSRGDYDTELTPGRLCLCEVCGRTMMRPYFVEMGDAMLRKDIRDDPSHPSYRPMLLTLSRKCYDDLVAAISRKRSV